MGSKEHVGLGVRIQKRASIGHVQLAKFKVKSMSSARETGWSCWDAMLSCGQKRTLFTEDWPEQYKVSSLKKIGFWLDCEH